MESHDHSEPYPVIGAGGTPLPYGEARPAEAPIHPGSGRRRLDWRKLTAPLAGLAVVGAKLKAVLLLAPKLKLLTTSGTMLVSIAAYSLIWGWKFAVGFVILLFIHEMGHV